MAKRAYETEEIRVLWDSERCIHSGICLRELPAVFDRERRPWVSIGAGSTAEIATAIEMCPSGALRYERRDGQPGEAFDAEVTIVPWPNGPLYVRGRTRIENRRGDLIREENRVALCRCGHSENKPFCDNSHVQVGFKSNVRIPSKDSE